MSFDATFTVRAHESGTDEPFARAIATKLGLEHHVIQTSLEELMDSTLGLLYRTLVSFDPMDLRNSLVVGRALQEAASRGYTCVFTGDAADEMFGGDELSSRNSYTAAVS